jgi:predicted MFS family arabinose efflux permease
VVFGLTMFAAPIYNVVQLSRRLAMIPDGLQGRVNSAFRLAANLLYPVGAALCGVLIEHGGTGWALALFTTVAVTLAIATAFDPVIRQEGRQDAAATPSTEPAAPSTGTVVR